MNAFRHLACAALAATSLAHAGPISGFESGLAGWQFVGDVSPQTAAIGMVPKEGVGMAFMTTMCDRSNVQGIDCETTINEHPYSGVSSPSANVARGFLGLPTNVGGFLAALPSPGLGPGINVPVDGEGAAMKTMFYASGPGLLTFDWNRVGADADAAYYSLWRDDGTSRTSDWIYASGLNGGVPSGVDLCARYYDAPDTRCPAGYIEDLLSVESGWMHTTVAVDSAGWYWFGIGQAEIAEGTVPTVLALDNFRFDAATVPEPATLPLVGLGAWVAALLRRKAASRR